MKLKIGGSALQDGLRKVIGVANAKVTPRILGNVLVEAKGGKVRLTASNLDITLRTEVPCDIEEEGSTTVPAKLFLGIVGGMPPGVIDVGCDKADRMTIRSGEIVFRISGIPAKEFPPPAMPSDRDCFRLKVKDLERAIRRTSFAQSPDMSRASLHGILFDFRDKRLKTVATDGRRLAMAVSDADWECADAQFILPAEAVKEFQRLLSGDGTVQIRYSGALAAFGIGEGCAEMYAKCIDSAYPNYNAVIPADPASCATCDRQRLIDMITRVSLLAVEAQPSVRLTFAASSLSAEVAGLDDGAANERIEIEYGGETMAMAFNPYFLLDALRSLDSDTVEVGLGGSSVPILVKVSDGSVLNVIMPLREQAV